MAGAAGRLERTGTDRVERSTSSRIRSCRGTKRRGCSAKSSATSASSSKSSESAQTTRLMREARSAGAGAHRGRFPACGTRTRRWRRASPRRSPIACWPAKASSRATSPSAAPSSGAARRRQFHQKWQEELEAALGELGLAGKLKRVEHHLSHAANAYYTSGFDEALIVTLDGYGSGLAGSVSVGRGGEIERLHGVEYPHSLGTFYESVTSGLGFQPSRHEGKIVGLAAYGDPDGAARRAAGARSISSPAASAFSRATTSTSRGCWRASSRRSTSPPPISTCSKWSRPTTSRTTCERPGCATSCCRAASSPTSS